MKYDGVEVILSLAGRTRQPLLSAPITRIGGFGGVSGLLTYLQEHQISALIDATHPFAAQISLYQFELASLHMIP